MKKPFHILLLVVTLIWVTAPTRSPEKPNARAIHKIQRLDGDDAGRTFLVNLAAKSDTRIDLPCQKFVPKATESEAPFLAWCDDQARDITSSVLSRHLYTQVTSSDL